MVNPTTEWNLTDLYQSMDDPAIAANLSQADQLIGQLEQYRDKLTTLSSEELLPVIEKWEAAQVILYQIDLYAGLLESTQTGVAEVTRFVKKTEEQLTARGTRLLFLETELATLTEEQWQAHLSANELQPYHKFLSKLAEQAKHTLSEPEEKILAEKSQTSSQAFIHLYDLITSTLEFSWDNETLTIEQVLNKFHDPDPAVRRKAAETLHAGLDTNHKTTPTILNTLLRDKAINDRLRHFGYPEQARFISDDVERQTVYAMTEAASKASQLVTRYYNLKKAILKTDQLYWWDRYAPLPATEAHFDQQQGITMVLEAFGQFSPEIRSITEEIISANHIDWLPSKTKRGGAFCAFSAKGQLPYVLLNYLNGPRDVMTLAHELGHAIHDVLAAKENVYFQTHPSLAVAEIASVFGETLLFEKLIHSDIQPTDKQSLLMSFIEDRFATVFRQVSMFQFEQQLHEKRRSEGELSKEEIDELWHQTMKAPFEGALTYTDEHKNTWMYVNHIFHTPFYVYSYAFAQLCVLALYQQYKEKGQDFVPTYITLLKTGGRLSPKDNLAQAGLDISQPAFWDDGLKAIEGFIDELEDLTNSLQQ